MPWSFVQATRAHLRHSRLSRAVEGFNRNHQTITAGHLAFIGLVSLFPFLIVLVAVAGIIGSTETAQEAMAQVMAEMPGDVALALSPVIDEVLRAPHGGALTLGILSALWAASSYFEALRHAFNRAYGIEHPRQVWQRRLQSLALTLAFAAIVLLSTLSVVVVPIVVDVAADLVGSRLLHEEGAAVGSRLFGAIVFVCTAAAMYKVLPRPRIGWREAFPGALVAVLGWFVLARAFSVYLTEVASLSVTYGSLGGVIATLLFFYVTAAIVLFGCEFNAAGRRALKEHA